MRRFWAVVVTGVLWLVVLVPVSAQDAEASVTVTEQVVVNGAITIASASVPENGWVVIHAVTPDGQVGPTVGIAPLTAGANENVQVNLDTLGATPNAVAMLHTDTGTAGVYEFDMMPDTDPMVMQGDQPVQAQFTLSGVTVFPQYLNDNTAVIGSVISAQDGWVVVSSDNNGAPGDVLGSTPIHAGTTPGTTVPLNPEGVAGTLWVTLHLDDGTAGTFEFDGQNGLDAAVSVNGMAVSGTFATSDAPVVITTLGAELPADPAPLLEAQAQNAMADATTGTLQVDRAVAPVAGWVEIHADTDGHPGKALGMVNVAQGENTAVQITLDAQMIPAAPPLEMPPAVWAMLHVDDNQAGVYEFMMVPGADVPVVYNGTVVTIPVSIGADQTGAGGTEATEQATSPDTGAEATAEATQNAGTNGEATSEATQAANG
jgi:hypothetical protein